MLIAVLSDIHGNLEAFQAVIEDMESHKPDRVICLGDLIGYGPNPEEVVALFRQHGFHTVLGNHEAALHIPRMRNWLNFQARENSRHTEKLLSRESLAYCRGLQKNIICHGALFVHGFPPSSLLQYVTMTADNELISFLQDTDCTLYFVGHSHELLLVSWSGEYLDKQIPTEGVHVLDQQAKYIVNAGSVGQPRDGNGCAKYVLWNISKNHIVIGYVPYDVETTIAKINERGFPPGYGLRLR